MARKSLRTPRKINWSKLFLTSPCCMTITGPLSLRMVENNFSGQLWDFWVVNRSTDAINSAPVSLASGPSLSFSFPFEREEICKLNSSSSNVQRWRKQPIPKKISPSSLIRNLLTTPGFEMPLYLCLFSINCRIFFVTLSYTFTQLFSFLAMFFQDGVFVCLFLLLIHFF